MLITASIVLIGAMILMIYMTNTVNLVFSSESQQYPLPQAGENGLSPDTSNSEDAPGNNILATLVPLFVVVPISLILIFLAHRKDVRPRQADPPQEPESYGLPPAREDD